MITTTRTRSIATAITCAALGALFAAGCIYAADADDLAGPQPPALETTTIQEDDPRWNCMTMGNRICGPNWNLVPQELADALAEGGAPDATTRDWEVCRVRLDDTTIVVCPDGWVETS